MVHGCMVMLKVLPIAHKCGEEILFDIWQCSQWSFWSVQEWHNSLALCPQRKGYSTRVLTMMLQLRYFKWYLIIKINSHLESNLMLIKVCALQNIIARRSTKDHFNSEEKNMLPNRRITKRNPFGVESGITQRKATCTTQENVPVIWDTTQNIRKCLNGYSCNVHQQYICNDSIMRIYFVTAELVKEMKESTIVLASPNNLRCLVQCGLLQNFCW